MKKTVKHKHRSDQIADHYGFNLIDVKETNFYGNPETVAEEEKIKVLQYYKKDSNLKKETPTRMFFHAKPILKEKGLKKKKSRIGLDILGVNCGIAEATSIKTAIDILQEEGYKNLCIDINSIGDKESVRTFEKELISFYKENSDKMKKVDLKKLVSGKVLDLFTSKKDYLFELNEDAPRPINFLSESSNAHFMEVLEYIEGMQIPYSVKDNLIGEKNYFSKIIFEIKTVNKKGGGIVLARGGRYDDIAASIIKKRKISAVGLQMNFDKKTGKTKKLNSKVDLYMVKLGFKAKLKSLEVAEILKKVNLSFKYNISEEKITNQLKEAIDNNVNYSIIIGQKEANEDKVLIRDMLKNSQKEVKITDLEKYLKKITK